MISKKARKEALSKKIGFDCFESGAGALVNTVVRGDVENGSVMSESDCLV